MSRRDSIAKSRKTYQLLAELKQDEKNEAAPALLKEIEKLATEKNLILFVRGSSTAIQEATVVATCCNQYPQVFLAFSTMISVIKQHSEQWLPVALEQFAIMREEKLVKLLLDNEIPIRNEPEAITDSTGQGPTLYKLFVSEGFKPDSFSPRALNIIKQLIFFGAVFYYADISPGAHAIVSSVLSDVCQAFPQVATILEQPSIDQRLGELMLLKDQHHLFHVKPLVSLIAQYGGGSTFAWRPMPKRNEIAADVSAERRASAS